MMDWRSVSFGVTAALAMFARWLYRGQRPNALARSINRVAAAVFARGVAPDYLVTLDVTGRRSGRTISLPLVMAILDRQRYLVSHLGTDVAWVRNVKATAGRAVLRHGRTEPCATRHATGAAPRPFRSSRIRAPLRGPLSR